MVIPTVARQKGITVRLYAVLVVAFASILLSLLVGHRASAALLPISDIPIIGKPVAGVAHVVTDGVVKPVANTVANALPQPVGAVVQAPVNTVTRLADPIIGSAPQQIVPASEVYSVPPPSDTAQASSPPVTASKAQDNPQLPPIDTVKDDTKPSVASYNPLTLSGFAPSLSDMVIKFATNKDLSPFIAAVIIIGMMLAILTGLTVMIIRNRSKSASPQELALVRQDLKQTSLLMLGLLVLGLVLLVYILH